MTVAPLVRAFEHLPNRPKSNEARPLLEKIASQVKPIMSKRGWKVGTLAEFLPANPALLGININRGQRIHLRLRPPGNEDTFYEYDQLVLLTHIVHGPHDDKFYKLLGELEEEYYGLKSKGYSGEGFNSDGHRLNGVRVNEYEGKKRGLAAAERRLARQRVMGRGGVLGGSKVTGKTMREIVAEAAERRLRDDKSCKVDNKEAEEEARKAQAESQSTRIDVEDLTAASPETSGASTPPSAQLSEPAERRPAPPSRASSSKSKRALSSDDDDIIEIDAKDFEGTKGTGTSSARSKASKTERISLAKAALVLPSKPSPKPATAPPNPRGRSEWACPTCTLLNPIRATTCDACTTPRPQQMATNDGWFCDFCGYGPRDMTYWTCGECGSMRTWG
ncbi:zinc ion binding protein [Trichosporon asahii var. asahii CBS 8904]|uniref:Zinc ion binding protein n=1 Tax=Trichosporon asahii var. asahii (strain CBS 8904) TaxID=1220162 RepID=K1VFU7_TRIAC|nr:zinc ion binding protein [Trichosporon asahii var. asahii CBS 8904]